MLSNEVTQTLLMTLLYATVAAWITTQFIIINAHTLIYSYAYLIGFCLYAITCMEYIKQQKEIYDSLPPLFLMFYLYCVPFIDIADIYIKSCHSIYSVTVAFALFINPFHFNFEQDWLIVVTAVYLCLSVVVHLITAHLVFLVNPIYITNLMTSLFKNLMFFIAIPFPYLSTAAISGKILECVEKINAATDHKTKMAYAWLSVTCTLSIITIACGNLVFLPFQVLPAAQSSQIAQTFSKIVAGSGLALYCKCRKKEDDNLDTHELEKQIQLI
jgi:hypothetical protein